MSTTRAYQSSNGDTCDLVRDGATRRPTHVRHTPAQASGGAASDIALDDFLKIEPHSPQHQAVTALMDYPVVETEPAARKALPVRGYIHDPQEEGGPYIAVVLDVDDTPTVTLHTSYAEAEHKLKDGLANLKQTNLSHRRRVG